MTTARADVITIASAVDKDGDTAPCVSAFGNGGTVSNLAGDALLLAADNANDRKVLVSAIGGHIWLSFGGNAANEPHGVVPAGSSLTVKLLAGQTLRAAPAALS